MQIIQWRIVVHVSLPLSMFSLSFWDLTPCNIDHPTGFTMEQLFSISLAFEHYIWWWGAGGHGGNLGDLKTRCLQKFDLMAFSLHFFPW